MILGLFGFATPASATTYTWNPFLGGSGTDYGYGIAVDNIGNVYITGKSSATWGSPLQAFSGGGSDAFVAKLNSAGNLIWNTFLGGGSYEIGYGIAVDTSGNVYVTGISGATWGSPIVVPLGGNNYFLAKLDGTTGGLTWNTFLSSTSLPQTTAVTLDTNGNIYVVGSTSSTWGSPILAYRQWSDGFVTKFDNNGNLLWNTFLGANTRMYHYGKGVAVDTSGNVYIVGYGNSTSVWGTISRAYTANQDAWVVKLATSTGAVAWVAFLGGSGNDYGYGVTTDTSANVYVTGYSDATWGSPLQLYNSSNDIFVAKLDSAGALTWNTFLGGAGSDGGTGIVLDASSNIYISGNSTATWGSPTRLYTSGTDAFVAKLTSAGALVWNTFLGGSDTDSGNAIAVDISGNVYAGGYSTITWETPIIPYTTSAQDAFATKLSATTGALVTIVTSHTITATSGTNGTISPTGATTVNDGDSQTFTLTPSAHYHVSDVLVDSISVGAVSSYTFTNVTTDHTISATFAIDTFTVTASTVNSNGSITPAGTTTLNYGASQTYSISANDPYPLPT
ncbi:MAG: SBBP repeat-containing protein [Candidatus Staskawiczbacteria bacterium]|nr:SBBP repeat-containing protein [Candidatus Staskawiczbacteria bacterium]